MNEEVLLQGAVVLCNHDLAKSRVHDFGRFSPSSLLCPRFRLDNLSRDVVMWVVSAKAIYQQLTC